MSAVQPCLETNDMSNASDLLNSFETIDEDKDSDEESFHLFLEGEGDEDISKENIEEKEEVNTISVPEENNGESLDKHKQDTSEITENENKNDEIISSDKGTLVEKQTELTEEIEAIKENETATQSPEDVTPDSNENINISKENVSQAEETISKPIVAETETEANSENEDDILNKHVSSEELSNNVEELDPNIEDSLLNECDDIEGEEFDEKNNIIEPDIVSASDEKKLEVTDSVVEEKSDRTVQCVPENVEIKCSEIMESSNDSEKNNDSVGNSQKCDDNSNSSSPDTDDLLDISMIKDSAQDDADIAEDALQLEQENDDSSSKGIVDNVEDSSHSDNSDEDGKEESEISEIVQNDLSDSEKDKDVVENEKEDTTDKTDEAQDQNIVENGDNAGIVSDASQDCDQQTDKTSKRNLSNSDAEPASKRIKLVEDANVDEAEIDCGDITELQNLISFSQFMTKSHLKKLTRTDLEEFCIQKLCEAILHKSELGETNHQLKILEQTIETLRRDQTVLTKQIKDLEIVNKKLMHEILSSNGTKPILPVKITRSVGLQVRLPSANDPMAAKRRSLPTPPQKTPLVQNQVGAPPKSRMTINTPNRPLPQPSPQKTTPILTQALQNRNRTPVKTPQPQSNLPQRPNISPKVVPEKRARTSGSFIDLTDEDDKRANNKIVNNKNLKSIVPQGVRINSVPKTTSVSTVLPPVVSTTTQQVMYVVQPSSQIKQGVLTAHGQKAVLVNFQPTNGVLNSLNSSSVSVIPRVTTNVPIKAKPSPQNNSLKAKHPAPLPNPPAIQGPLDKNLKGIPPKPVVSFRKTDTGIILQWRMPYDLSNYEAIASYQVYAYQETSAVPSTDMWRKVGDVKAMPLPMACTLAQFKDKNRYYFSVRPVDVHKRIGKFSHPVLSE